MRRRLLFASHIALEEAGLEFEAKRVDLFKGEQQEASFLSMNPKGRIPVSHRSRYPHREHGYPPYAAMTSPSASLRRLTTLCCLHACSHLTLTSPPQCMLPMLMAPEGTAGPMLLRPLKT